MTSWEVLNTLQRLIDWHARSYQPDSPEWKAARDLRDKLGEQGEEQEAPPEIRFNIVSTTSPDRLTGPRAFPGDAVADCDREALKRSAYCALPSDEGGNS